MNWRKVKESNHRRFPSARFSRPVARRRAPPSEKIGRRGVARTPGLTVRNRVLFHLSYATSFVVVGACSTIRTCVTALMRRGLCPLSYASELAARRGFDPLSSVRQTDCHASSITGLSRVSGPSSPCGLRRAAFVRHRLASRSCGAVKAGRPPEIRTPTSGIKNPALCR